MAGANSSPFSLSAEPKDGLGNGKDVDLNSSGYLDDLSTNDSPEFIDLTAFADGNSLTG